jgi:hypothetical protein
MSGPVSAGVRDRPALRVGSKSALGRLSPLTFCFGDQVSSVARGREEADTRLRVKSATSGHTIDQETAMPMTGFKVQPP